MVVGKEGGEKSDLREREEVAAVRAVEGPTKESRFGFDLDALIRRVTLPNQYPISTVNKKQEIHLNIQNLSIAHDSPNILLHTLQLPQALSPPIHSLYIPSQGII